MTVSTALGACSSEQRAPESRLELKVGAATFPGVGNVIYALEVRNGAGDLVWQKSNLASATFGDGKGGLTFIGPCDASSNPHSVALSVTRVFDEDGVELVHPTGFMNPTLGPDGSPRPIVKTPVTCEANRDTLVRFDLTLMRSAEQGFFDIAVDLADVFCSAKLDCRDQLLHDAEGDREETVIITAACTSGKKPDGSAEPTYIYMSDFVLTCTDPTTTPPTVTTTVIPIASATTPGNQGALPPNIFQWALYHGKEGFADLEKCYQNYAVGLDMSAIGMQSCVLTGIGTAASEPFEGGALPEDAVYPVIVWDVEVTNGGNLCPENRLNANGSGVQTVYSRWLEGDPRLWRPFSTLYECGEAPSSLVVGCVGSPDAWLRNVLDPDTGAPGLQATIAGATSDFYVLPDGARTRGCCTGGCCE